MVTIFYNINAGWSFSKILRLFDGSTNDLIKEDTIANSCFYLFCSKHKGNICTVVAGDRRHQNQNISYLVSWTQFPRSLHLVALDCSINCTKWKFPVHFYSAYWFTSVYCRICNWITHCTYLCSFRDKCICEVLV